MNERMNKLMYFETFCWGWEYALLTTPYYVGGSVRHVAPSAFASAAIQQYVKGLAENREFLWDSGDFVYGLS